VYNKNIMDTKLPHPPVHASYLRHRKEMTWQIVMPIVLTFVVLIGMIVLISLATFRANGDVERWAAISTIWIMIPIMISLLIFLALMIGIVYLLARLLHITPKYTGLAQDYVYLAKGYVDRALDMIVKQVLEVQGVIAKIQKFFEKLKP
jgi:hypothetical protein